MPIARLLETDRGKILLVNAFDMATSGLLAPARLKLAVRGLKTALNALPTPRYSDNELMQAVGTRVYPSSPRLHANGLEKPSQDIYIAAVRTFDELSTLLRRIQKAHPDDISIRRALRPRAPDHARADAARIVNQYATRMPQLTVGGAYNFFWATTLSRLREVERQFMAALTHSRAGASADDLPNYVRDMLGLVHIKPDRWGQPCHMFVLEGQATLSEIASRVDFRCARPTTIDGFDNPRFRQRRPKAAGCQVGFGLTVDLGGGPFADGVPELVSTEITLAAHFACRWLGKVSLMPPGKDDEFVAYIQEGRDLNSMADHLNGIV